MHQSPSSGSARKPARPSAMLILGGARSGKSRYAQTLAEQRELKQPGLRLLFLATAVAEDDAMRAKIERHREDRPQHWDTIEEPLALAEVLLKQSSKYDLILIDCLTLYTANLLARHGEATPEIDSAIDGFSHAITSASCSLVMVSNEAGSGVVPSTVIGSRFRDLLGEINQRVAMLASDVVLMVAGLPLVLKSASELSS